MPRRRKTAEAPSAGSKSSKTAAIVAALQAHPDKMPKELAGMLQAEGLDVKPQTISVVKSKLKSQKKPKETATPIAAEEAAPEAAPKAAPKKPAAPKAGDAISLDSLKKAKELATQLGGIQQAKAAIAALAELVD